MSNRAIEQSFVGKGVRGVQGKKSDLTGEVFGKLTVMGLCDLRKNGCLVWKCRCACGRYINVTTGRLNSGNAKTCGRLCESYSLIGKRFDRLTVRKKLKKRYFGNVMWECVCDCGAIKDVDSLSLKTGNTRSCGCLKVEIMNYKKGVNHYNYNKNLTDEERLKNRYQLSVGNSRIWSQNVFQRDNYTCQICGDNKGRNLNAHHLNGWNAFPEQRFDLDNGVTLCTGCHKEFHSEYGYGDNTREQFDEYAASKTLVLN